MLRRLVVALGTLSALASTFGAAEDLRWCGKHYQSTDPADNPGGWLSPPATSSQTLLDLRIRPRMSIYVLGDDTASFIVDTAVSHTLGEPFPFTNGPGTNSSAFSKTVITASNNVTVLSNVVELEVNQTSIEIPFSIGKVFRPRLDAYNITLTTTDALSNRTYSATTSLTYLPQQTNSNSTAVRLDSLTDGSMSVLLSNDKPNSELGASDQNDWHDLFPYSYYVNWGDWLSKDLDRLDDYKQLGYNMIHIIPAGGSVPFDPDLLAQFVDKCEDIGMYLMYDMRWTYQNSTLVESQVNLLKDRRPLLLWYTADEPDGQQDPLDATEKSYEQIRSLDPYHPVSLVLNCGNYHFDEYSRGADILLSDAYPIGINATFSTVWNTPCNTTYGDCGCDNCRGRFEDVSDHIDDYRTYNDNYLGRAPKAIWGVPQAFGNESYWPRYPTADEEVLMNLLSVNHNAKGIVMWTFPTTAELTNVTSKLANLLTGDTVVSFLGKTAAIPLKVTGAQRLDAAGWNLPEQDEILVSMVYLGDEDVTGNVTIELGVDIGNGVYEYEPLWGDKDGSWNIGDGLVTRKGWKKGEVEVLHMKYEKS